MNCSSSFHIHCGVGEWIILLRYIHSSGNAHLLQTFLIQRRRNCNKTLVLSLKEFSVSRILEKNSRLECLLK